MSKQPTATADDLLGLEDHICFALQTASRAFGSLYRDALGELRITYPQYLVLLALTEHGELPVKRIGELLRLDSGTLSPLLKRLEAAGLVQRTRSIQDERSVDVNLTAKGAGLSADARRAVRDCAADLGLDPAEIRLLHGMLQRLTDRLDTAGGAGVTPAARLGASAADH
ncbi:MarR family winged helix-turn-helix transcriptional regulator [Streptacidiphilus carbonis]|uniref:MarR family winged helix-turn-helix transcriptional regulator n=1 Tax=Streptacidiphilus carbonis TaxID=105422 RepID=UPI0005A66E2F|nr:MarR family transcriptional regulator [Streptacidiphilus carbonis]